MIKKLLISVSSLVTVLALGAGATYALFTSSSVTMSANTLTTGSAAISICNNSGSNIWTSTISPAFTLTGLVPGGDAKELTAGQTIYLGNDNGTLNNKIGQGICSAGSTGNSSVSLKMIPTLSVPSCGADLNPTDLLLDFNIGGVDSGYFDLNAWHNNAGSILPSFAPGDTNQVKIFAKLISSATAQNKSCTFDVIFTGAQ